MPPTKRVRGNLIVQIAAAFPGQPMPVQLKLTQSECEEACSYDQLFAGRTWPSMLDTELLRRNRDALFFLTPEAFRYYLPAFLTV